MKRLAAIVIALAMVIGLVPAVASAASDNAKITYNFVGNYADNSVVVKDAYAWYNSNNVAPDYSATNGFWKFAEREADNVCLVFQCWGGSDDRIRIYAGAGKTWYSVKIRVPESGTYTPTVKYVANTSFSTQLEAYLLPGSATKDDITSAISSKDNLIGTANTTSGNSIVGSATALSAGEYIVVFHTNEIKDFGINSFVLTKGSGEGALAMSAAAEVSKNTVNPAVAGDYAQISVSKVFYSDFSEATTFSSSDLVYSSSNESALKVDSTGKITAASAAASGTSVISVAAASNPGFALASFEVSASTPPSNLSVIYNFKDNYSSDVPYTSGETTFFKSGGTNAVDTYAKSNGMWRFDAQEGSFSVNHQYDASREFANGLRPYYKTGATWFAIRIRVPKTDTYAAKLTFDPASSFTKQLDVYLLDGSATSSDINESITNGTDLLGSVNCTSGSSVADASLSNVSVTAGEHIVVFKCADMSGTSCRIHAFKLISGDGSAKAAMGAAATVSKNTVNPAEAGDYAQISVSKVFYSDATGTASFSSSDLVYSSSNESALKVDSTGKITAASAAASGISVISVADAANPGFALASFEVAASAPPSNLSLIYDFKDNYSSDVPYTSGENNFYKSGGVNEVDTYAKSNGMWKFGSQESPFSVNHLYDASREYSNGLRPYYKTGATWFAIRIRVPKTDVYASALTFDPNTAFTKQLDVYLLDGSATSSDINESITNGTNLLGSVNCQAGSVVADKALSNVSIAAGEHIVVFKCADMTSGTSCRIHAFKLIGGDGSAKAAMAADASASKTELTPEENTASISISKIHYSDATSSTSGTSASNFVFTSRDASIATVDASGNISLPATVKSGTTYIDIASKDDESFVLSSIEIKVAAAETLSDTVKVYVTSTNNGADDIESEEITKGIVEDIAIGTSITVTAKEIEGKQFAYWKNYANTAISDEATYTFKAFVNTGLIAVYDDETESEAPAVEFWDGNGAFIKKVSVTSGATFGSIEKPTASITGYNFLAWSVNDDETITKLTRAVALYSEEGKAVSGITVNGAAKSANYGDEIVAEDNDANFSYWTNNGKIVSYSNKYTFYAWDAATVVSVRNGAVEKQPSVALSENGGAYMAEYDVPAGFEKIEAGIIFGGTGVSINGFVSKATSKTEKNHGQFTALPAAGESLTQSTVRAYLIYRDGETVKVVYSD